MPFDVDDLVRSGATALTEDGDRTTSPSTTPSWSPSSRGYAEAGAGFLTPPEAHCYRWPDR